MGCNIILIAGKIVETKSAKGETICNIGSAI
jgi:hypothetical protein